MPLRGPRLKIIPDYDALQVVQATTRLLIPQNCPKCHDVSQNTRDTTAILANVTHVTLFGRCTARDLELVRERFANHS